MKARILYLLLMLMPMGMMLSCEHPDTIESEFIDDDDDGGGGSGNGGGGGSGGGGTTDKNKRYTVMEFINGNFDGQIWVKGYIVGACYGKIENANYKAPFTGSSAILLADKPGVQNIDSIIPIQLVAGVRRNVLNLEDHPENFGCQAEFFDFKQTYFGRPGMKGAIGAWHLWDKDGNLVEY